MSQENTNNSWYKFLEGPSTSILLTDLERRNIALTQLNVSNSYPEFKLCFLVYECQLCMKYKFEARLKNMCEHKYCDICVPRVRCSIECSPWLIQSLPTDDLNLRQGIINKLKERVDLQIVNVGPTNKRKKSESEDDETQEYPANCK